MNQSETSKLLSMVQAMYPNFQQGRNIALTTALWEKVLADEDFRSVCAAYTAYLATDTRGFPPAPGALKEILHRREGDLTEVAAWAMVRKAISNSAYDSEREFAALPETLRRTIGDAKTLRSWALMNEEEVETVISSNFQRSYKARAKYETEAEKIPEAVRAALPAFKILDEAPKIAAPAAEPEEQAEPMTDEDKGRAAFLQALKDAGIDMNRLKEREGDHAH